MHRVFHPEKMLFLLVLYIGGFCSILNAAAPEPDLEQLAKEKKVYVEPSFTQTTRTQSIVKSESEYRLMSYRERRHDWGFMGSFGYSTYEPMNYESAYSNLSYRSVYGKPIGGMFEGVFSAKRNFSGMSVGGEIGLGTFNNSHSDPNFVNSTLNLTEIRAGASIYFDGIFPEPTIVPYASGGLYMMVYKEVLESSSFRGTTQGAPYLNAGVAFQLDWIDRKSARIAYEESGVLTSYLYLEARKYFTSTVKKDPDFGNTINGVGGFRVEF